MQEIPSPLSKREIRADLENRFTSHRAKNMATVQAHDTVRTKHKALARWVHKNVPDGREKDKAIDSIEQAMFWANAAVARHQDDEDGDE
jgi:hypothetical protein